MPRAAATGALRAALPGERVLTATYRYVLADDAWSWSDELFLLHGHGPGSVPVTTELVLGHAEAGERSTALADLVSVVEAGGTDVRRTRVVRTDGAVLDLLVLVTGERDADGTLVALQGRVVDVTVPTPAADPLPVALSSVVAAALRDVPGCDSASVTLLTASGRAVTVAASDPLATRVDVAQYDAGDGPCLTTARTASVHLVPQVEEDRRWPGFRQRARTEGVVSALCAALHVAGLAASLNLYSLDRTFLEEDVLAARALSRVAEERLGRAADDADGEDLGLLQRGVVPDDVIGGAVQVLARGAGREQALQDLLGQARRDGVSVRRAAGRVLLAMVDD